MFCKSLKSKYSLYTTKIALITRINDTRKIHKYTIQDNIQLHNSRTYTNTQKYTNTQYTIHNNTIVHDEPKYANTWCTKIHDYTIHKNTNTLVKLEFICYSVCIQLMLLNCITHFVICLVRKFNSLISFYLLTLFSLIQKAIY